MAKNKLRNLIAKTIWEGGIHYPRLGGSKWENLLEYVDTNPEAWTSIRDRCLAQADAVIALGLIQEWQPIKTAPKDGTWVLVWTDTGIHLASYHQGVWNNGDINLSDDLGGLPTHWMPRPDPPNTKTGK